MSKSARQVVVCPHCGLRVLTEPGGHCPSCRKRADEPVTEADLAMAARIAEEARRREAERESGESRGELAEFRSRQKAGALLIAGSLLLSLLTFLAPVPGGIAMIWWGPIVWGLRLLLVRPPPSRDRNSR